MQESLFTMSTCSSTSRAFRSESVGLHKNLVDKEHPSSKSHFFGLPLESLADSAVHQAQQVAFFLPEMLNKGLDSGSLQELLLSSII